MTGNCYSKSIKTITIETRNYENVLVKYLVNSYPRPLFNYVEVTCDIDRKNFKVTEYHYRLLTHPEDRLARWIGRTGAFTYITEAGVKRAEAKLRKQVRELRAVIEAGKQHPAYAKMAERVQEIVHAFHEDFTWHDLLALGKYNFTSFRWIVRRCGTNIYWDVTNPDTGEWLKARQVCDATSGEHREYWVYDNGEMRQVKPDEFFKV